MLLTFFCVVYLQLSREVLYSILESPLHPYFLFNTVYVITGLYLFRRTIRLFRTMTAVAIANYCVSTELLCLVSTSWSLLAGSYTSLTIANYCVSTRAAVPGTTFFITYIIIESVNYTLLFTRSLCIYVLLLTFIYSRVGRFYTGLCSIASPYYLLREYWAVLWIFHLCQA